MRITPRPFIPAILLPAVFLMPTAWCDDGVIPKMGPQPNRTIETVTTESADFEFNAIGNENLLAEKSRQRGVQFPIRVSNYATTKLMRATGPLRADNTYTYESKVVDYTAYSEDAQGKRIPVQGNALKRTGLLLKGNVDAKGEINIESVTAPNITDQERKVIDSALKPISDAINRAVIGPDKPLKIGDGYTQQIPMALPIPGQQPLKLAIEATYKLIRIVKNIAFFDIIMRMQADMKGADPSFHLDMSGSGKGSMQYDIKSQLQVSSDTDLEMKMAIHTGEIEMAVKAQMKSNQQQLIVNPAGSWPVPSQANPTLLTQPRPDKLVRW